MLRTLILILCSFSAMAQQKEVVGISAAFDSNAVAELYSTTPIGLEITYTDSSKRKTTGLLKGDYRWSQVTVESPDGEFNNGTLRFNRNRIRPDNYRIKLLVTLQEDRKQREVYLQLPYLTNIRFHHYADSLKRGLHFYLNVEGIYNTGKIYPLDTARVRLDTDIGQIIGQDLLIPATDSITKTIVVRARYRGNSDINTSSVIPVKQGPEDQAGYIENEKDVFKKPAKKKKQ